MGIAIGGTLRFAQIAGVDLLLFGAEDSGTAFDS